MSHWREVTSRLSSGLRLNSLVELCARKKDIRKVAVEGVRGPPQCLQLDRVVLFTALEVWNCLLADPHAGCQFGTGHPERVADRPDPASVGTRRAGERPKPL